MTVGEAAKLLKKGGVVAFPTETVYGLGAVANNPDAVRKIFELKGRPDKNPLIVHLHDHSQVSLFTDHIPEAAKKLMDKWWPGPLTLIFHKRPGILDAVSAGLPTIALRIPRHPVALELLRHTGPLAAPSANRSGKPSPTKTTHVIQDFGPDFPVLEGGDTEVGLESTVLDVTEEPFTILRPGKYTPKELSRISQKEVVSRSKESSPERSPGVMYTHYKPAANVRWFNPASEPDRGKTLLISHTTAIDGYPHHRHYQGDFDLLARELYDLFRTADLHSLEHIVIEQLPENRTHTLVEALRNRIEKAVE